MNVIWDDHAVNELPEFSTARERFDAVQGDVMCRLSEVIRRHGMSNQLGLTLLHQHYKTGPGERLERQFHADRLEVRPIRGDGAALLVPVAWKFGRGENLIALEGVGTGWPDRSGALSAGQALAQAQSFREEFVRVLRDSTLDDLFGLVALQDVLPVGPGQILAETTDDAARVMTIRPAVRSELPPDSVAETHWAFDGDAGGAPCQICFLCNNLDAVPRQICVLCNTGNPVPRQICVLCNTKD